MTVGASPTICLAVNPCQDANVAVLYCVECANDAVVVYNVGRKVEYFALILQLLVDVVVESVLCKFPCQAVNARVADNVNLTAETVCTHHRVDVAQNFRCHLDRDYNLVAGDGVLQGVGVNLRLVGFECRHCVNVQSVCKNADEFRHLAVEVALVGDFVV